MYESYLPMNNFVYSDGSDEGSSISAAYCMKRFEDKLPYYEAKQKCRDLGFYLVNLDESFIRFYSNLNQLTPAGTHYNIVLHVFILHCIVLFLFNILLLILNNLGWKITDLCVDNQISHYSFGLQGTLIGLGLTLMDHILCGMDQYQAFLDWTYRDSVGT